MDYEENRSNNRSSTDNLNDIMPFIDEGTVIPIISNSFRVEEIFRNDKELQEQLASVPKYYDEVRTIDQELTRKWAKKIGYPMSDDYNLARVAQYRQVESGDPELAKIEYLKFINDRLLKNSENEKAYKEKVAELRKQAQKLTFSDVAQELDYPRFENDAPDPLRLLAKLNLPIYITTSYSNFMERALVAENRPPRTQICFWSGGKSNIKPEYLPDPNYVPTPANPAVYHLFGLEDYKNTLILSEDDYMGFIMNAAEEINSQDLYPTPIRGALPESRLVLIGYNLRDWDFRTLFRFIARIRKTAIVRPSIAIQFKPNIENKDYESKSFNYLMRYFEDYKFKVKWTNNESFIYELWDTWNKYKQGLL